MDIEDQVCSFEFAKRLKELGLNQSSLFFWQRKEKPGEEGWNDAILIQGPIPEQIFSFSVFYSAYTVAELGQILPDLMVFEKIAINYWTWRLDGEYLHEEIYCNEADCRAKAIIWCIENGVINLHGCDRKGDTTEAKG